MTSADHFREASQSLVEEHRGRFLTSGSHQPYVYVTKYQHAVAFLKAHADGLSPDPNHVDFCYVGAEQTACKDVDPVTSAERLITAWNSGNANLARIEAEKRKFMLALNQTTDGVAQTQLYLDLKSALESIV